MISLWQECLALCNNLWRWTDKLLYQLSSQNNYSILLCSSLFHVITIDFGECFSYLLLCWKCMKINRIFCPIYNTNMVSIRLGTCRLVCYKRKMSSFWIKIRLLFTVPMQIYHILNANFLFHFPKEFSKVKGFRCDMFNTFTHPLSIEIKSSKIAPWISMNNSIRIDHGD